MPILTFAAGGTRYNFGVSVLSDSSFTIGVDGKASFSADAVNEMEQQLGEKNQDETTSVEELANHPIYGSKHTYCCKMGNDGNQSERQQFRSYSWQAPLFCMRIAKGKGYNSGSVSRGECD